MIHRINVLCNNDLSNVDIEVETLNDIKLTWIIV